MSQRNRISVQVSDSDVLAIEAVEKEYGFQRSQAIRFLMHQGSKRLQGVKTLADHGRIPRDV